MSRIAVRRQSRAHMFVESEVGGAGWPDIRASSIRFTPSPVRTATETAFLPRFVQSTKRRQRCEIEPPGCHSQCKSCSKSHQDSGPKTPGAPAPEVPLVAGEKVRYVAK